MPALLALFKLIPLKDYLYGALVSALLIAFGVYTHHERTVGAAHTIAAVEAESNRQKQVTAAAVKATATQYTAQISQVKSVYETQITAAASQHDSDAVKLRNYETRHNGSNPVLQGSSNGPSPASGIPSSAPEGNVSNDPVRESTPELADAVRTLDAALSMCVADRNSLTGK